MTASVTLSYWRDLMTQSVSGNHDSSHPWICEVRRNGKESRYKVLRDEDYRQFYKNQPWWSSNCRKLNLEEIIKISKFFFNKTADWLNERPLGWTIYPPKADLFYPYKNEDPDSVAKATIDRLIQADDILSESFEESVKYQLRKSNIARNELSKIASALDTMVSRAKAKQSAEKTRSVWGRIKRFFWKIILSKKALDVAKMKQFVPKVDEIVEVADVAFKIRIHYITEFLADELKIEKPAERLETAEEAKNFWLQTHKESKFQQSVTNYADNLKKKLDKMLNFWERLPQIKNEVMGINA